MEGQRSEIVILGAGNVATHLATVLDEIGHVGQIWSRDINNALTVSERLKDCQAVCHLSEINRQADLYIISVVDDAIPSILDNINDVKGIIAHTSGSVSLKDLQPYINEKTKLGVLYPLQTFSRHCAVDIKEIPFFIEGNSPEVTQVLEDIAGKLSSKVYRADSQVRGHLHIAAVFACNFVNHLWAIADIYLKENTDFNLSVFEPLMKEVLRKALDNPHSAQTGPAVRNDKRVIARHLAALRGNEAEIYKLLSESIVNKYFATE